MITMMMHQDFPELFPAPSDPGAMADRAVTQHPQTVAALGSVMRHPRSLSRPVATWRPPTKKLPALTGRRRLNATISRHRVGPAIQRRLYMPDDPRVAAYLVFLRISAPDGRWVDPGVAQGWVRALVGSDYVECVHELPRESTPTYVWVVDGSFLPIASPAELVTPAPVPAR